MMRIYISGSSSLSPQDTFSTNRLPETLIPSVDNRLTCVEPSSYASYVPPVRARRMSRIIKMGLASTIQCLENGGLSQPEAIIVGTALGCLEDTEKFLMAMIQDDEQFLTPTHFIQSTQNSVGAQIAMHLQCRHHNFTFVHKGFSFESAVIDGIMLLRDGEAAHVLIGGLDEMTDRNYQLYSELGLIRKEPIPGESLLAQSGSGTIAGEGAAFFTLTSIQPLGKAIQLVDIQMHYGDPGPAELSELITLFLERNQYQANDLSLCLVGLNGDRTHDQPYQHFRDTQETSIPLGWYKHLCGEYQTSSAFAMWLGTRIFIENQIPDYLKLNEVQPSELNRILIVTNYANNYSFILLESSSENG